MQILELPWNTIVEEIKKLRDVGIPALMYYVRSEDPAENSVLQESPEDTPFTNAINNALMTGTTQSLKNLVVALLCRPGPRVEKADLELTKLDLLISMGMMEP